MKRFVGLTFVMFLAVAFGSSVVEAGCKHRRHCGHGCHASSCETTVCESAPVVEECVVEECAPSHCHHRRHHCGLFGHKRHCHHRHHCHNDCQSGCVESSSACGNGGCNGGEVVVSSEAAPAASAEVIKEGTPTPAAPAAPKAPAAPAAPKAPATSGT